MRTNTNKLGFQIFLVLFLVVPVVCIGFYVRTQNLAREAEAAALAERRAATEADYLTALTLWIDIRAQDETIAAHDDMEDALYEHADSYERIKIYLEESTNLRHARQSLVDKYNAITFDRHGCAFEKPEGLPTGATKTLPCQL